MAPHLRAYLSEALHEPFNWQGGTCLGLTGGWLMRCGYPDPCTPWAGRWSDEASARALLAEAGGLAALMADAAQRLGLQPSHAVRSGDVGAVTVRSSMGPELVAGIWTGRRWVARAPRGLWGGAAPITAAWRVEV